MGEPGIPSDNDRAVAIQRARVILENIRNDEDPSVPGLLTLSKEQRSALRTLVLGLASTLDLTNTALQRACAIADEVTGSREVAGHRKAIEIRAELSELRSIGIPVAFCAECGKRVATCFGNYEDHSKEHCPHPGCTQHGEQPACDHCCEHGNEDGHCREIEDRPAIVMEVEE